METLAFARKALSEGYYRQAQKSFAQAVLASPHLLPQALVDFEGAISNEPEKIGPRLALAGMLLTVDGVESAILELEEALEAVPNSVEAYNVLGRIYIKQERIAEAILLLERSIAAGVRDVNLTEILAAAYLEGGREAEAVKFYEEILLQKPGDKQTLRVLGELYTRAEEYNRAAASYQAMFSEDPEVAREVVQRLEELLKKVEGSVVIREILAEIYMKTLNPEGAVARLLEILRLEPLKLGDVVLKLKTILKSYPGLPSAMLALGEAQIRQGNFSEAVETFNQLARAKPELINEAIRGFRHILEIRPDQVLARAQLGEALIALGQEEAALAEFNQMIQSDPSVADLVIRKCRELPASLPTRVVLGRAYFVKGEFQKAAQEAESIIAADKNLTAAYLLLGESYAKLNLLIKAVETLQTALAIDPFNAAVHDSFHQVKVLELDQEIKILKSRLQEDQWKISLRFDLARRLLEKGDSEGALRELQLVQQKDVQRAPQACNLMGSIYRREGRYDLAAAQYNRALEMAPPEMSRQIRFNLGLTFEAQGEVRKAIKAYEDILREDIDFGDLKKRVKQLKATGLAPLRNKPLQAVIADFGGQEIVALWGREVRPGGRQSREEVSVSFGQEHNQEGFNFYIKGMYQAAEEEFALAIQLDRRFGIALNNYAVALARQGKIEEARLRLAEAVETDPASAIFYSNLGVINIMLGRSEAAKLVLEKAFELDNDSSAICLNLGDLYYREQAVEKALGLYRRIGAFDPLSDLAEQRLLYKLP